MLKRIKKNILLCTIITMTSFSWVTAIKKTGEPKQEELSQSSDSSPKRSLLERLKNIIRNKKVDPNTAKKFQENIQDMSNKFEERPASALTSPSTTKASGAPPKNEKDTERFFNIAAATQKTLNITAPLYADNKETTAAIKKTTTLLSSIARRTKLKSEKSQQFSRLKQDLCIIFSHEKKACVLPTKDRPNTFEFSYNDALEENKRWRTQLKRFTFKAIAQYNNEKSSWEVIENILTVFGSDGSIATTKNNFATEKRTKKAFFSNKPTPINSYVLTNEYSYLPVDAKGNRINGNRITNVFTSSQKTSIENVDDWTQEKKSKKEEIIPVDKKRELIRKIFTIFEKIGRVISGDF